ncbi:hypothetical protein DRN93_04200 [archaeon]|nr:MAG: hypothetical protein DRN93_04200 [archaeon]
MRWEELIEKPIEEMSEEEVQALIDRLNDAQLSTLEAKVKKAARRRRKSEKEKKAEDLFEKLLLKGNEG